MGKIAKSLCLVMIIAAVCEAQIIKNIGLNAGYAYTSQQWKYVASTGLSGDWVKPISTFSGGVFAESYDVKNFSLFTKVQYVGKGRSVHMMRTVLDADSPQGYKDLGYVDLKDRLDYICIPILLKYRIAAPVVEPFIAVGPRFEYLVGHQPELVYDRFRKTEWTMSFSAGTDVSVNPLPKIFIEAEYNTSLTDSYKGEFLTVNDHSIELLLGVYF